jgi:hypothetical protein
VEGGTSGFDAGDAFLDGDVRYRWRGWRRPVNQDLVVGFWVAMREELPKVMAYSTTLGECGWASREGHVLPMCRVKGWPWLCDEDASVKARALDHLRAFVATEGAGRG